MRVIFDLDGTLADCEHRRHLIKEVGWNTFFEACSDDTPMKASIAVMQSMLTDHAFAVEVWSGRSDAVAGKTKAWLMRHVTRGTGWGIDLRVGGPFFDTNDNRIALRMRPAKDFTPDHDLKRRWLNEARDAGAAPDLVFDDRQKVVDMWREEGVACFQVAPGDF